jgi:hypothetical protein
VFKTTLPDQFKVDETQIQLSAASHTKDLTSVLTQLMDDSSVDPASISGKKFNFLVNDTFLTEDLAGLLKQLNLTNESVIEVYYLFALEKPKPKHTSPQDEWVSAIAPLASYLNEKAKSYAVALMNGDLKIYDQKHAEQVKVSQLHLDTSITDCLYFKSDLSQSNILVTASEVPNPALVFAEVSADRKHVNVIGRAK